MASNLKILLLLPLLSQACGEAIEVTQLPQFRYYLESPFTGQTENTLIIEGEGSQSLSFKLSGDGFTAEAPLNTELAVRPRTKLQVAAVGDYNIDITFAKADGTPLFRDQLKWSYSLESPDTPIVGFSETASNDVNAVLLVAESRDPGTNEIWIEGDIAPDETPEGKWRPIPSTSKVPLRLSESEGLKTVRVRLRNEFKNPTVEKTLQILKKSTVPTNCYAAVIGSGRASRYLPIYLSGENQGPLYYRVFGDLEGVSSFQKFEGALRTEIILSKGSGNKKFTIQIRDEAENYCARQEFSVDFNPSYQAEGIAIKDQALWSEADEITVLPRVDHFPSDQVEMYIHGDIEADSGTFVWLPYSETAKVKLAPINGHRWVRVQFRINGEETSFRYAGIYFKPFLLLQGSAGAYNLGVSDIQGLEKITITGCSQIYTDVAYQVSFPCSPTGSLAQIRYDLKDGSSIVRSVAIPP